MSSAAEKLKALDKTMPHAPTHIATWPLFWEFRNALPQIVALVELAEQNVRQYDEFQAKRTGTSSSGENEQFKQTRAALSALDEQLS